MAEVIWPGKYQDGRKVSPVRISLPFQTIESVNETLQDRQKSLELFTSGRGSEWRNRLIWGDKKYVLPSLLAEFEGKVNLIYIDPPFDSGADFSYLAEVPEAPESEAEFVKEPSLIEIKAYRDTWGVNEAEREQGIQSLDKYLKWFAETATLLRDLLTPEGSIYVHLDWHVGHYAKAVLDEVFGPQAFTNEIVWYYYNKFQGNINRFASNHDVIFYYRRSGRFTFHPQEETRETPARQLKRAWDKEKGRIVNVKGKDGRVTYQDVTERRVDDVWRIPMLQPADRTENLGFPTQKREALLQRIISASSNPGDLVLDCFVGSGTTAAVAEKLGRRWIACDLGRFAIHTARKRMLALDSVRPFVVQNLGKYERQAWQAVEFRDGADAKKADTRYRDFILRLYHAEPLSGYAWLHGIRGGRLVHVGAVDAPVTLADVKAVAADVWRAVGKGKPSPKTAAADILGWDFAFELNELGKQIAAQAQVDVSFKKIPREVLDPRAVEEGDVKFFELAALRVDVRTKKRDVTLSLKDFVISPDDVPDEIRRVVKHWSQFVDYWAIDWDYRGDSFHNQWQSYRTRARPKLETAASHSFASPGIYTVVVKVIDILGNDTTKAIQVEAK
jgi:adenine-specific DNA-methyltransferase